jgi:hypothetical protein
MAIGHVQEPEHRSPLEPLRIVEVQVRHALRPRLRRQGYTVAMIRTTPRM